MKAKIFELLIRIEALEKRIQELEDKLPKKLTYKEIWQETRMK